MEFNQAVSSVMLLDVNSCFATIEQQANPLLRGKPVAVAAFTTPRACILAASVEAKRLGIKTGMRVAEGQTIYPGLAVLPPDPAKYRNVHLKLRSLLSCYAADVVPKSIDEFVFKPVSANLRQTAVEIKERIKKEIGEWITVSVGISTNRYLAKVAAGLVKPDGLTEINKGNYLDIYSSLGLTDLTGIKTGNAARLNSMGIHSVLDFYLSPVWKLKAALRSVTGLYWYTRLRGYEVDGVEFGRRSFGNSVALGKNLSSVSGLAPVLSRLVEKMSARLRAAGFKARGVHLSLLNKEGSFWHKGRLLSKDLYDFRDFYKEAYRLLSEAKPSSPVANIAVSCFGLTRLGSLQTELFRDTVKNEGLVTAIDKVNERWGDFVVGSARSREASGLVLDRIAFGSISEL